MSTVGDFIRRQRELQKLSMRQLAGMVGISNPYLSQIERGLREPSERVMESIARSFDLTVDALYEQAGGRPERDGRVEEAIRADPHLRPAQRRALLEIYAAFRAHGENP